MRITFWGTRGSVASPGEETAKYGGNTTCLEVRLSDRKLIVLDAGTGIRKLGLKLVKQQEKDINIFLTHPHWDHIQGFPFFGPMYIPGYKIQVYGWPTTNRKVQNTITDQMEGTYFPVDFSQLQSDIVFHEILNYEMDFHNAKLSFMRVNHPVICHSIKIQEGGRTFIFMTDNELDADMPHVYVSPWAKFVEFCSNADLLVHDTQFTPDELEKKKGWGHSSYIRVLELAKEAGVKGLVYFHHDPEHTDMDLDEMLLDGMNWVVRNGCNFKCFAAQEGMTIEI
jgi:phosphoribosyl 1,2-cyclic phosphodiesterase